MNPLLLSYSHDDQVARLVMNAPDTLNAMNLEMAEAFRLARAELAAVAEASGLRLRAIVISGEGRAFSAGGDLSMLQAKASKSLETNTAEMMDFYRSFLDLRTLDLPLVCAVQGHVVGAGFCFTAACDLRIGDETALFSAPFTRLGLHPGMGGSFFLPRSLGSERARDLMLTGRRMTAAEAEGCGFLARLVAPGKLEEALEDVLGQLLKGAPEATRAMLRSAREDEAPSVEKALRREAAEQAQCYARPEFLEGISALSQRRAPIW